MNAPEPPPASLELAAPGLRLRPWQPEHVDALHEAARESIATVGRWLGWCHAGYSRDDAVAWIAHCRAGTGHGEPYAFGVFGEDGRLLGGVGLNRFDRANRSANLGYWVRAQAKGLGVAPRAARALARFGFDSLALCRIEIVAAVDNRPSRRCAEKIGARLEGIARHRLVIGTTPTDAAVYGLLPDDPAQPAAAQSAAMSS